VDQSTALNKVRILIFATLGVLALQLLLGVATNLWVRIPAKDPWNHATQAWLLYLHALLGLALLGNAIMVLIRVREAKLVGANWDAWLGILGVLVALVSGAMFVTSGRSNIESFIMTIGFVLAMYAYAHIGLTASRVSGVAAEGSATS